MELGLKLMKDTEVSKENKEANSSANMEESESKTSKPKTSSPQTDVFPFEAINNQQLSRRVKAVYKALSSGKEAKEVIDSMVNKEVNEKQAKAIVEALGECIKLKSEKLLNMESGAEKLSELSIPKDKHIVFLSNFGYSASSLIGQKFKSDLANDEIAKPRKHAFICLGITLVIIITITPMLTKNFSLVGAIANVIVVCLSSFAGVYFAWKSVANRKKDSVGPFLVSVFLLVVHTGFSLMWIDSFVNLKYYAEHSKVKHIAKLSLEYIEKNKSYPKPLTKLTEGNPNYKKLLSSSNDSNLDDVDYIIYDFTGYPEDIFIEAKYPVRYWFKDYRFCINFGGKMIIKDHTDDKSSSKD